MNNSESIKRNWIRKSESMKYNDGFRRAVEDWTGQTASDHRDGSDTGMEMERNHE